MNSSQKWQNTQITFNTDKEFFINESKDSLLFTPNSKYKFNLSSGNYHFNFSVGTLTDYTNIVQSFGQLKIYADDKLIKTELIDSKFLESWVNFNINLELNKSLTLEWESNETYLFIGNPILTNKNQKNDSFNVLFIVIDALRHNSLGFSGSKLNSSPNMDKIAEESIVFKNVYSNANWTKPSMISMFYSEYSSNLGLSSNEFETSPFQKSLFYNSPQKSLPNIMRDQSYFTFAVMNNVFFLDYTGVGVDLGFQSIVQVGKEFQDTEKITEKSIELLKNIQNPFLFHLNYNTPHGPYDPPSKYIRKLKEISKPEIWTNMDPIIIRYYAEILYTDDQIGKIVEELKNKKIYDNTFIIITSDHGELFSDHHDFISNHKTGVKFGHGQTLYEEEIKVPLLIKYPKQLQASIKNKEVNSQMSLVSILPTILGLLNIQNSEYTFKGKDFSKYILGDSSVPEEKSIYTEGRLSESIKTSKYKYIRYFPGYTNTLLEGKVLGKDDLDELYDLEKDPLEQTDIKNNISILNELKKELKDNSLKTNQFHIYIPLKEISNYSGTLHLKGGIHSYEFPDSVSYNIINRKQISFETKNLNQPVELKFNTVYPYLNYDLVLKKNDIEIYPRVGKWGLILKNHIDSKDIVLSSHKPENIESSNLPWIYNDGNLSSSTKATDTAEISKEVKNILKGWGYIHE